MTQLIDEPRKASATIAAGTGMEIQVVIEMTKAEVESLCQRE